MVARASPCSTLLSLKRLLLVTVALTAVWTALQGIPPQAGPALACSITSGELSVDYLARESYAVALVEVLSVRGADVTAPPVPPPPGYPQPARPPRTFDPNFTLEGYGARLQVKEAWTGSPPSQFDVDQKQRQYMEEGVRAAEIGFITPCPLDFLATQYAVGSRYVAFLRQVDGAWETSIAYEVQGDRAQIRPDGSFDPLIRDLIIGEALQSAFLADLPFTSDYPPDVTDYGPLGRLYVIKADSVPLSTMQAMVRVASTSSITPPDTGDGGVIR